MYDYNFKKFQINIFKYSFKIMYYGNNI